MNDKQFNDYIRIEREYSREKLELKSGKLIVSGENYLKVPEKRERLG